MHARLADASLHREAWQVCEVAANSFIHHRETGLNDDGSVHSRSGSRNLEADYNGGSEKDFVVEAILHEGLGNQLFQIAFAERLARALTQHARATYALRASDAPSTTFSTAPNFADASTFESYTHEDFQPTYRVKVVGHPDPALLPRLRELGLLYSAGHGTKSNGTQPLLDETMSEQIPSSETVAYYTNAEPSVFQEIFARTREGRKAAAEAAERAAWPSRCGSIATLSDIPTYAASARKSGYPPFVAQVPLFTHRERYFPKCLKLFEVENVFTVHILFIF